MLQIIAILRSIVRNCYKIVFSIACRQLGFQGGRTSYNFNYTSDGADAPIGLDRVQCTESDRYISDCSQSRYYENNCYHDLDVFLKCFNGENRLTVGFSINSLLITKLTVYVWSNLTLIACEDPSEFFCANGRCIPGSNKCDFYDDCGDSSDEDTSCCEF